MQSLHHTYLEQATGAMSRRDYLSVMQYAIRAAGAPRGQEPLRCDAYLLLALSSLELDLAEDALAFAVGAHLSAMWARDQEREARASSVVAVILAHHPELSSEPYENIH